MSNLYWDKILFVHSVRAELYCYRKKSLWKSLEEIKRSQAFVGKAKISTFDFLQDFYPKDINEFYNSQILDH